MSIHPIVEAVTQRIAERSRDRRADYLVRMAGAACLPPHRGRLSCSNLAHVFAAAGQDKSALRAAQRPNLAIVTAYNDMLSAHQP
ncbi:MAG: phosphogluconate dehydratase, partial [Steroidobacteraceae bacterium]